MKPTRPSSGFTVTELLIVIALLAVLLLLAFPVIGKARRQSEAFRCANSLRQLGQAAALFGADNSNAVVPYALNRPFVTNRYKGSGFWYAILYPYLGFTEPYDIERIRDTKKWKDSPYYCPNERTTLFVTNRICGWNNDGDNSAKHPFQRFLKMGQGYSESDQTSAKYGVFTKGEAFTLLGGPGRTAYFADGIGGAINPNNLGANFLEFRHEGHANVLFMDGHIEKLKDPDFKNNPQLLREDDKWVFLFGRPARTLP